MKEKNMFDALENADQSVIDRLSAEFPPQDTREKEKIFKMSERKFNNRSGNTSEADNHTVSGVEVYKKPKWQVFLSIAAAFVIVAGGITGGLYAKKHLGRLPVISTDTEKKTAPFGNFAELDYKLCDYNNETAKHIFTQNDENAEIFLTLFSGSEISQSKLEKLADFFNNYDYKELPEDMSVAEAVDVDVEVDTADTETIEVPHVKNMNIELAKAQLAELGLEVDVRKQSNDNVLPNYVISSEPIDGTKVHKGSQVILYVSMGADAEEMEIENTTEKNIADEQPQEKVPSFVYDDGNEARLINIYDNSGMGVLSYTIFHYEERDGELRMTDKEVTKGWQIDYELFKSTINEILTSEDENGGETPTEPAQVSNCPFDLAAHDFYLADPESKTRIEINLNSSENENIESEDECIPSSRFHLIGGKIIPLEKRQKLAEFFNNWNWEESDEHDYPPQWLLTYEEKGLFCIEDNEAFIISLNRDTNSLLFTQLQIELNYDSSSDDESRYISYDEIGEPSSLITKSYKIDYDLFIGKIREVLGDDFIESEPDQWSFIQKEWSLQTDEHDKPAVLSADDKNDLYDMFRKCQFKEEGGSNESLSTAEAMEIYNNTPPAETDKYIILTCDCFDSHNIIYFETKDDKTNIRYYDYGVQGAYIPNEEYRVNIYNYTCDDKTLVDKIKEYNQ